ncbi:MAG: serine hydrolase domain-containing protein [Bacteroidales bacterium]|jgi:CubicO group peptidase (beta-lactamase class C family)
MKTRKFLKIVLLLLAITIIAGAVYLSTLMPIITGYAAKNLCSGVFVAGREASEIEAIDLSFMPIKFTKNRVDYENKIVKSRFLWSSSKAVYREGYGVTLVRDVTINRLLEERFPNDILPDYSRDTIDWPKGDIMPDSIPNDVDIDKLTKITENLVSNKSYGGTPFAFMVVYKGIPVAEKYMEGLNEDTRFLSWSMAKSFTNAIVGSLSGDNILDIYEPVDIEEWGKDDRKTITIDDLMRMQSGLAWNEDYGSRSDVNVMLHCKGDMARFAIKKPLEFQPGEHWYYSSGSTNIVNYLIKKEFTDKNDYYRYVYDSLFYQIGITGAVFEVDVEGTMVGSSYLYATARDYARFGLLYLEDGVFDGTRVLPEGWVDYTVSETVDSDGRYGSSFWLNRGKRLASAPEDLYYCSGHDGQQIFIIPSEDIVIVVLGYSPSSTGGIDFNAVIGDVLDCIE